MYYYSSILHGETLEREYANEDVTRRSVSLAGEDSVKHGILLVWPERTCET